MKSGRGACQLGVERTIFIELFGPTVVMSEGCNAE